MTHLKNSSSKQSLNRLEPHSFNTKMRAVDGTPKVYVSKKAHDKMVQFVDLCSVEVGWLGTVERDGMDFYVLDVFLFDQEVSASTTNLDGGALADYGMKLANEGRDEEVGMINFWGHSHHNMPTSPSKQDEKTMLENFNSCDYVLRAILNKKGEMSITAYFPSRKIRFDDVSWQLYYPETPEMRHEIKKEMQEKVSTYRARKSKTIVNKSKNRLPGAVQQSPSRTGLEEDEEKNPNQTDAFEDEFSTEDLPPDPDENVIGDVEDDEDEPGSTQAWLNRFLRS